ncbi:hypothetical protein [Bacillus sp. REN3]|uniref:hypothetical protein n=1 Tax=Bacillus sp. REN3 TaxID=2802440 RepID=UPI001AEDB51E|nr:hypothetical protein [Bacillus sp. REN3]
MKIYSRDFTVLTKEELKEWEFLKEKEVVHRSGNLVVRRSKYREYPAAVRHYESLFPNNHLDIVDLQKIDQLTKLTEKFHQLIDNPNSNERSILNWIRENSAYFIIAFIHARKIRFDENAIINNYFISNVQ